MTDSYQNQDLDNINPLQPATELTTKKKMDPKIKILFILGAIVVILLILSLFTASSRRTPKPPARTAPTPTIFVTPMPTENPETTKLPSDIKEKFQQIDQEINSSVNFNPPQIDTDIGL